MNSPILTSRRQLTPPFGEYWIAYRDEWEPDLPVGLGKTELEAINSLQKQEELEGTSND